MSHYARHVPTTSIPRIKPERRLRRSKRVKLSLCVVVHGKTSSGEPFREVTHTLSVSANGGLLVLAAKVEKQQTIVVENKSTRKQQECRVVYVGPPRNRNRPVGVEFTEVTTDFWQIHFPPAVCD